MNRDLSKMAGAGHSAMIQTEEVVQLIEDPQNSPKIDYKILN